MIFKKRAGNLFFLLSFLFFSHCGLNIGEKAPPVPTYPTSLGTNDCKLDYKEEFSSYFLKEQKEIQGDNSSGQRLSKALNCLTLTTKTIKDKFEHEHLEKQQLLNLLNLKFIKTTSTQPFIDHITDPAHFDTYIFIKDALIYLMEKQQAGHPIKADKICKAQNDKFILSKQEIDTFTDFLENLSEFFLTVEKASYEVFNGFFKSKNILLKSQLEESDDLKKDFISFLSSYLSKDFPGYSSFLDKHLKIQNNSGPLNQKSEVHIREQNLQPLFAPDFTQLRQESLEREFWNKILQSPLDMIRLPPSFSDTLTVQNVKYIMLNIYIMKILFSVYDTNQNFKLDPEELQSLPCLITPLVSIFLPGILSEKLGWLSFIQDREFFQDNISSPETIVSYIINHQDTPDEDFAAYANYILFHSKDLENLYYSDVSRLISVLFSRFFEESGLNKESSP